MLRRLLIVNVARITSTFGLTPTSMNELLWNVTGQCQSM